MHSNILLTKLYIPKTRSKLIKHESLIEKFNSGMERGSKLTLISAPAGYGKTTLVLELIDTIKNNYSWISLDDGDNDIKRFLTYIIAAVKNAKITIGRDMEKLLSDPQLSISTTVLTMLINDISRSPEKFVLVLDDYHVITSNSIHETMRYLIDHQPPNLHIVLTTREDPPLMLPKLRVRGQMTEIRVNDLRFSKEDAQEFFSDVMGIYLKKDAVDIITSRTEGWAAGLQLVGLSIKDYKEQEIQSFVEDFGGTNRYVIDYLVEEVLRCQDDEIRDFLIKTSILGKMNPGICDYVTGRSNSKEILHRLEQVNLFIIPLDEKREWYRYHHLFADSLKIELEREEKQLLYKKAAVWLEANGFKEDAVNYAFKSQDMGLALALVEKSVEDMFKNAELPTLVKWLDALPEDMLRSSEILSVRRGWALYITGSITRTIEYVDSLGEDTIKNITPHNRGLLLSLQALLSQFTKKGDTEKLAIEALKLIEPWDPVARIATMNTLGGAQADSGRTVEASETYKTAYNEGLKLGYTFITTLSLLYYGVNLNILGKRQEAINLYKSYTDGMTTAFGMTLPLSGLIYVSLGGLYYEGNELAEANDYLLKGMELCKDMSLSWILNSEAWLAKILYAKGDRQGAMDIINEAYNVSSEQKLPRKLLKVTEVLIELLLREGKADKAAEMAEGWKTWLINGLSPVFEWACLVYIRALIAQNKTDEALKLLEKVEEPIKSGQRLRLLITANILYSRIYYIRNEKKKAYEYMDDALKLAEGNAYIRAFLDEEEGIADILSDMEGRVGKFGEKLLSLMKTHVDNKVTGSENTKATAHENKPSVNEKPFEQLSEREIELLRLIAGGLTNNEISKKLYITVNTTQWHISNIYSKLGVKNRTQAIIKARELKLL